MKTASAIYKMVRALLNSWYEWRVIQGEYTYGLDKLRSLSVSHSLTSGSGISIGNATSATCKMALLEESANWPRMARFTVQFRICLGASGTKSEWITFGTFYTDERSEDKLGNLYIVAYDGMLKMEQSWTDRIPEQLLPASYPITARAWATMIQSANLATFDDLTQLNDTLEFVGLDTTSSIRDVLKNIAAVHGGNWVMTDTEKLKLVQFENVTSSQTSKFVNLGLSTQKFDDSPALDAVSGVRLETTAGVVMEAGDSTGYVVKTNCDVSDTNGIAQLCLTKLDDYVFKPFQATTAYLDPIAEIGDSVSVDGTIYQIMSEDWTLNKMPSADIAAPYDQEIDHEYKTVSQEAKNYRKTMASINARMDDFVEWTEVSTAIEQNANSVVIAASGTYVTQTVYDAQIAEIQSQLDGSIQTWSGNAVPTLNNSPAVDWNTPALKAEHVGDTYFVNSDAGIPEAGSYYRFENNNGTYGWQLLTDSALTEALAQAAAAMAAAEGAQSTANTASTVAQSKGRIFVNQPTPPYDVGDLWFNSTQSVIKVCMTARASGSYVASDWVKRDMYTDDSALTDFVDNTYNVAIGSIQNQIDQKAETYYQSSDPAFDWGVRPVGIAVAGVDVAGTPHAIGDKHEGDLWYNTTNNTTWYWNGAAWEQQDIPSDVFDMIDGKAQIFVSQPTADQEYDVGDLWVKATYSDSNVSYSNDILKCKHHKGVNEAFDIAHWELASKYTDDSALTSFVNTIYDPAVAEIQASLDGKVDTYFYNYVPTLSNIPASEWNTAVKKESHIDDLFYNTNTGYVYRFNKIGNTYVWERVKDQDITTAMSTASTAQDTADGKRRVFVSQPTNAQAYDIGDLWVNATYGSTYSNDLLKCKTAKAAGATFSIAHWEKASKYTDDTAANAVGQTLVNFRSSFSVQPDQISTEIEKRVIKDKSTTKTTFGWKMDDTSHTWYSNNSEVMKIQQSGLTVTGNINAVGGSIAIGTNNQSQTVFSVTNQGVLTARSGYIGNGSSGFTISASAIYNGMTALGDTSHNGIYLGTDGIALGKGNFKVTSDGRLTAKYGYIGNGSSGFTISATSIYNGMTSFADEAHDGVYIGTDGIALGGGKIKLYADGTLEAQEGWFLGLTIADSIRSDYTNPGYGFGTFNGGGLTEYSVHGGENGQIGYTNNGGIIGANMEYSTITTDYTNSGINTSLGYANFSNGVFTGTNTAQVIKSAAIIDTYGNTYYPGTLAYKNHQGTNVYAKLWISTTD